MTRLILTFAIWMGCCSVAPASLSPRKERLPWARDVRPARPAKRLARALPPVVETRSDFVVTKATQVLLDGKPCRYEEIPARATIIRMEVAADGKTVLKIHFRSRK